MTLNNKVYEVLKWIALILLPALSTFVMSLGDIWGIPYKEPIALTITAVDTFLGALLAISTASYKGEGKLIVENGNFDAVVVEVNSEDTIKKAEKTGKILLTVENVETVMPE